MFLGKLYTVARRGVKRANNFIPGGPNDDFADLVPAPRGASTASAATTAPPTSRGCAARFRSSTPWPSAAPTGCGSCCKTEPYVNALGALTGNQAMQLVRAGLKAIYLSGWQVAADANTAGAMYPDQSLYPANAGPELCRRINSTLRRADQIEHCRRRRRAATGSRRSSPTPRPASAAR